MSAWLVPLFALTALIYASVGFAGGRQAIAARQLPVAAIPGVTP